MQVATEKSVAGARSKFEQNVERPGVTPSLVRSNYIGVTGDGSQVNLKDIGLIDHSLKPRMIYAIGDSHAMFFKNQLVFEKHTGQSFFVKHRYMASPACVPSTVYTSTGIDPRIIAFLRNEGLFFNGEVKHYSRSPSILAEASISGQPAMPPFVILSCGDIAIRSEILPKLADESIVQVPGSPYNDGLPKGRALPYEAVVARIDAMARPVLHAALELRRIGFPRIFVHSVVPPSCDRALFDNMHGFVVHQNVHYNIVYLFNKILREICAGHVIDFVDNWDLVTDENGFRRPEFELDGVHLGTEAATFSLQRILRRSLDSYYDLNFPRYRLLYDIAAANFEKSLPAAPAAPREEAIAAPAPAAPSGEATAAPAPTTQPQVAPASLLNRLRLRKIARAVRHPREGYAAVRRRVKDKLLKRLNAEIIDSSNQQTMTIVTLPPEEQFKPKDAPNAPTSGLCNHNARPDFKISDPVFARAAEEFFRDGCTTVPLDQDLVQSWRDQLDFRLPVTNPATSFDWAGNAIDGYSDQIKRSNVSSKLLQQLCDRFAQKDFEELFGAILGCRIVLQHVRAFRSDPVKSDGAGPQAWHNDGCPDGLLRGILYMTNVDERSGAFQYKNKNDEVVSVNGPSGTLAIFDADQVLHRGSPPLDRHREAFDLTFSPRMSGESMMAFADGTSIFPNDPFMFSINSTIGDPSTATTVNRYQAALKNIGDLA
jgi:hypothetical protein